MPPKKQPSVVQSVKVVVQAPAEKKPRRRRRRAVKKQMPRIIERFVQAAIPSIQPIEALNPSVIAQAEINKRAQFGGGVATTIPRLQELVGPAYNQDVLPVTPRFPIQPIPFPALPQPPKPPRVRQPREDTSAKKQAIAAHIAAFGEGKSQEWYRNKSAEKLREMVAQKQELQK